MNVNVKFETVMQNMRGGASFNNFLRQPEYRVLGDVDAVASTAAPVPVDTSSYAILGATAVRRAIISKQIAQIEFVVFAQTHNVTGGVPDDDRTMYGF